MNDNYSDIINLPHHVSTRHPQMSMISRAAQFAPFSALTGLDDAIDETAFQWNRGEESAAFWEEWETALSESVESSQI